MCKLDLNGSFVGQCLATLHLITGEPLRGFESVQEKWFQVKPSILNISVHLRGYFIREQIRCHDILILGRSTIKRRLRPDMTVAVDWDTKPQIKHKLATIPGTVIQQTWTQTMHYENMPMQYREIFKVVKMKIFRRKCLIFFLYLFKT